MRIRLTLMAPLDQTAHPPNLAGYIASEAEEDIARLLLRPHLATDRETLLLAGFDAFDRLVRLERVGGDSNGRCIIPPQCWRKLMGGGVVRVIMAHNHPSNIAQPSDADIAPTRETAIFLRTIGIELVDHLIFV
ncbi:JAB domain-containing protein [Sphingopyxis sp.]|uniref:JAB domain-containing protein n=1 Tax=Sphingopyxis sp. TaxID=1908224 RepID=UPI0025DA72E5|nr:JAB domain-containing protein [Sphingopyxis sp.]